MIPSQVAEKMGKVMAFFAIMFMAMRTGLAAATGQSWVKIHNRVGGPITVQCASRDDKKHNLGVHVLQNMQQPAWSIDENFFGTTLFWCNFIWQQCRAHVDIWSGGGIWKFGKLCDRYVWDVAPNGFRQSEDGGVGVRWIQGWIYPRQLQGDSNLKPAVNVSDPPTIN